MDCGLAMAILPPELRARFEAKINRSGSCWLWVGGRNLAGYGIFHPPRVDGRVQSLMAHRVAYELHVGPIPAGLQIDHLCGTKACVNPAHLEAVTSRENTMRAANAPATINAGKTRCPRGHEYDYLAPGGRYRGCLTCWRQRA